MRFKERVLPFAALQIHPVAGDPEATLERFRGQVRTVRQRHPDVGLVIAPELHLMAEGGLLDPGVDPADLAAPIPSRLRVDAPRCAAGTGPGQEAADQHGARPWSPRLRTGCGPSQLVGR